MHNITFSQHFPPILPHLPLPFPSPTLRTFYKLRIMRITLRTILCALYITYLFLYSPYTHLTLSPYSPLLHSYSSIHPPGITHSALTSPLTPYLLIICSTVPHQILHPVPTYSPSLFHHQHPTTSSQHISYHTFKICTLCTRCMPSPLLNVKLYYFKYHPLERISDPSMAMPVLFSIIQRYLLLWS